jgi:endonuclease-3
LNDARRAEIFARLAAANPDPRSELEYASDFELLVAVILSAQATDRSVNRVTPKLFAVAGTPERMIALGLGRLKRHIRTIGLYNNKAKSIMATARALVAEHGGRVPRTREALEALPGVGRKTASVILNVAFGEPTIAVDTHIFRVANRTRLATGRTPLEIERKLLRHTPAAYRRHAHHWLILHGRYICVARAPKCKICIINDLCEYPDKLL